MSIPADCCTPCSTVQYTSVPGTQGASGVNGADGTNGQNAYTVIVGAQTLPANSVTPQSFTVLSTLWMVVGETVIIGQGGTSPAMPLPAHLTITAITNSTTFVATFNHVSGDAAFGAAIPDQAVVTPSATGSVSIPVPIASGGTGQTTAVNAITALTSNVMVGVTLLTDNTTGAASSTLAAGAGIYLFSHHLDLANITSANQITTFTIGHKFKLIACAFIVHTPGTGGGASCTLQLQIGGVSTGGGLITLNLANTATMGAVIAGTAVSAPNTGTNASTLGVLGVRTVAFATGDGTLVIAVQNMDSADAIASLSAKLNSVIDALT